MYLIKGYKFFIFLFISFHDNLLGAGAFLRFGLTVRARFGLTVRARFGLTTRAGFCLTTRTGFGLTTRAGFGLTTRAGFGLTTRTGFGLTAGATLQSSASTSNITISTDYTSRISQLIVQKKLDNPRTIVISNPKCTVFK
jgi:hypothetical protein